MSGTRFSNHGPKKWGTIKCELWPSRKASNDLSQLHNQRHPVTWAVSVLLRRAVGPCCSEGAPGERTPGQRQRRRHLKWTADPRCWTSCSCCSVTKSCPTLCNAMNHSTPGFPVLHYVLAFAQIHSIELVMLSNHLILCCPFLLLPSIFLASRSFPVSRLYASGGQTTGASASESVIPMNIQGWFPLEFIDWSLHPRDSQESSPIPQFKSINPWHSAFFMVHLSHPYITTGETMALTRWTIVCKVMCLLFNMLSRFIIVSFQEASMF